MTFDSTILRWFEGGSWLPRDLPAAARRESLLTVRFAVFTWVFLALFAVIEAIVDPVATLVIGGVLLVVGTVPSLVAAGRQRLGAHLFLSVLTLGVATMCVMKGGLASGVAVWFGPLMIGAVLMVGGRGALPWLLVSLLVQLGLWFVDHRPWPDDLGPPHVFVAGRAGATVFAWWLARTFAADRADAFDELRLRQQEAQLLLDCADQGFVTIDAHGALGDGASAAVARWLGPRPTEGGLVAWLRQADPQAALWVALGLENLSDGFMETSACLEQMRQHLRCGDRTLALEVRPTSADGRYLVVLTDRTEALARERVESARRETLELLTRLTADRHGSLRFVDEMDRLLRALLDRPPRDEALRLLHTVKGNAALFGLSSMAGEAHRLEERTVARGEAPTLKELDDLRRPWRQVIAGVGPLLGRSGRLDVRRHDVDQLVRAVAEQRPLEEVALWVDRLRKVPASSTLLRLQEAAEDLAVRVRKTVRVRTRGSNVLIDAERWAPVVAVVPHLLRNALDHGIEPSAERRRLGKPSVGRLRITLERTDSGVRLSVVDDGRGIDWDQVRRAAAHRGLPCATPQDLERALLSDGLSTAETVTELSGRGVGTSAVWQTVKQLGGTLSLHSEPGEGTTVSIELGGRPLRRAA